MVTMALAGECAGEAYGELVRRRFMSYNMLISRCNWAPGTVLNLATA